ncbi:MAG: sugar MFS transporter [Bacteroidales bacterium]|nr:sugar MFS transporter [Bacteroidales bacterium]
MKNDQAKNRYLFPLTIVGGLFFILGFITWLNSMLIPFLKLSCELNNFQAFLVTSAFYISYTLMALPASYVLEKTGFKLGMSIALWVMALGALIFIPAAYSRSYQFFLSGVFVLGSGMALLQTAVNPYVTILGPMESAAKRISIMGIANKVAGTLAPLVLAYFVVYNNDEQLIQSLQELPLPEKAFQLDIIAERVITPYAGMSVVLLLLGAAIYFVKLPQPYFEEVQKQGSQSEKSIFQFPHLWLGVLALFAYVGAEVVAGDTIIQYALMKGWPIEEAKVLTSITLSFMLIGYLAGIIFIPKFISQEKALTVSAILGLILSAGIIFLPINYSIWTISFLGIANALVWPAIWPLALKDLGALTAKGSALLIMAISGGAILPLIWGRIADKVDAQNAYWVLIPAYFLILYYSTKGYKLRT